MSDLNLHNINEHLRVYVQESRQVKRLEQNRQVLILQIQQHEKVLEKLEAKLKKKASSVDALENNSIRSFAATLMGQREQLLENEYRRFLSVRQKRDALFSSISDAKAEIAQIDHQLDHLGSVEEHYAELIALKEKLLLSKKTGPYVLHLEKMEHIHQDHKAVQHVESFVEKLNILLRGMSKMVLKNKVQEHRSNLSVDQTLRYVLLDWKTLQKGFLHLNRLLDGLLEDVELELPRQPDFYPKLFDHFVRKQLEVVVPTGFQRFVGGAVNNYWNEREANALFSLETYSEEVNSLLSLLKQKSTELDRILQRAEQERKQLLEQL